MENGFKKIISFIEKTGDRCILIGENGDSAYVILPFREYEKLIGRASNIQELSEEEFLDKINRDIAVWKTGREDEKFFGWEFDDFFAKKTRPEDNKKDFGREDEPESRDTFYFEPID